MNLKSLFTQINLFRKIFLSSKKGTINMIVTLIILVAVMMIIFLLINNWDALAGSLIGNGEDVVSEGLLG